MTEVKKASKPANYTEEQAALVLSMYAEGETVEAIAEAVGKTTRSIIAKLSRSGVYKAKTYVNKQGEKPVKKDTHADAIGAILKMNENDIDSLTKCNKRALEMIFNALANSKPISE